MRSWFRIKAALLVVLVVLLVNLPVAHSSWRTWQIKRSGTDVTARVFDSRVVTPQSDPEYHLWFRLPERIDPAREERSSQVDRATYQRAKEDGTLTVRVLPDQPAAHRVEGAITHRTGLVVTLVLDGVLLGLGLLLWRGRGRLRPELRGVAVGDVERCEPGSALDRVTGDLYLIRGAVSAIEGDEVVLDLGDRSVRILLDGHPNPVGYRQPAQVQARLIG